MVLTSSQTALTAAAAAVVISAASSTGTRTIVITNAGATNNMHLGPSGVNASTGFPLAPGAQVSLNVPTDVAIYAFSTSGTTAAVLEIS